MLGSASLDGGLHFITPLEEWAVPRGTATPGQPMAEAEQAPLPKVQYQLKFYGLQWRTYQILS